MEARLDKQIRDHLKKAPQPGDQGEFSFKDDAFNTMPSSDFNKVMDGIYKIVESHPQYTFEISRDEKEKLTTLKWKVFSKK